MKRWKRVDHDVCYQTTKISSEIGVLDVFLHDNPWTDVSVPHDWNTRQPSQPDNYPSNGFKPRGIGWYYNAFKMPECGDDACVLLEFEGIMGESVVYVNGVLAARNESGYTGFTFDMPIAAPITAPPNTCWTSATSWACWSCPKIATSGPLTR